MAEAAFAQAEYIISTDLTTLQAFVIYLAILRHEERSRRSWTLISLAVRIAHAHGVHSAKTSHDPFTNELRRRLWHQLRVLDLQLAVDLASDSLILPGTHDNPPPANVNDADLVFGSTANVKSHVGWTDMSFSLMQQVIAEQALEGHTQTDAWQKHQQIIHELGQTLETRFFVHCDESIPFHAFAMTVGRSIVKACLLHAVRPTSACAAPNAPSVNSDYVLSLAVETLEASQACVRSPPMEGWRWTLWVQWHALAVAFASLTFVTSGPLSDRAWLVAEEALKEFASITANAEQAQLRRPLEKLAAKARQARNMQVQSKNGQEAQPLETDQPHAGFTDTSMSMDGARFSAPYEASHTGLLLPAGLEAGNDAEWWPVWQDFVDSFPDPTNSFGT